MKHFLHLAVLFLSLLAASRTAAAGAPAITSSTQSVGKVGKPFTYQITATNNPTSYGGFFVAGRVPAQWRDAVSPQSRRRL